MQVKGEVKVETGDLRELDFPLRQLRNTFSSPQPWDGSKSRCLGRGSRSGLVGCSFGGG